MMLVLGIHLRARDCRFDYVDNRGIRMPCRNAEVDEPISPHVRIDIYPTPSPRGAQEVRPLLIHLLSLK
jgi:hypothetical protein